jgi:hypothetical protein
MKYLGILLTILIIGAIGMSGIGIPILILGAVIWAVAQANK